MMKLGECAQLVRNSVDPSELGDTPYIGLEHIGENSLHLTGIGSASDVTSAKSCFDAGDVLFGKLRPYFRKVAQPRFEGVCSTDIWVLRSQEDVSQEYLFYLMASPEVVEQAIASSKGTRMPRADWTFLASHQVAIGPLDEQRRVARVLRALDDRIELNRRMCETLEEMAQALFKSWFVDFEPVRAKMEDRWQEGESLPGLPAHLCDMFPDRLVDSELGLVPQSWHTASLDEIADHLRDTIDPGQSPEREYALYSIPAFDSGKNPELALGNTIRSNKCIVKSGTVLLSRLNPDIERVWFVGKEIGELAIASTEFAVLRPKPLIDPSFLYCTLRSDNFRNTLVGLVTGTSKSHQRVRPQALASMNVLVPSENVLAKFASIALPWFERILALRRSSWHLTALRDTMLPKLITGEVQLPNVSEMTEC